MSLFNIDGLNTYLPWWMFDLDNFQLIVARNRPTGTIEDTKEIAYVETPIPGRNGRPAHVGGFGNRTLQITLPLIQSNNTVGNVFLLKQFEQLRQPAGELFDIIPSDEQFTPNPKVLYNWGVASVPLVWDVKNVSFSHDVRYVNQLTNPKWTNATIELALNEDDPLNQAEKIFTRAAAIGGFALSTVRAGAAVVDLVGG